MSGQSLHYIRAAIRERSDVFEQCFDAGDAAGLVQAYYVSDPSMSAPDAQLLRGRDAITGLFTEVMKAFRACRLEQVEVRAGSGLAYEVGRAILTPRQEGPATVCRYMIAWRHTGEGWRVEMDFFAWGII